MRAPTLSAGRPPSGRPSRLPNAPDITTAKGLRVRAIIAVLLGCALRRPDVAALTDVRSTAGFTPEAMGDARREFAGGVGCKPFRARSDLEDRAMFPTTGLGKAVQESSQM